jgi:hypothetical protein
MTTAMLEQPAPAAAPSRRCEVLLRCGGMPGTRTYRTECGNPAASLHRAACRCGHESSRQACQVCARSAGTCRLCWDEGHECQVTIMRLESQP